MSGNGGLALRTAMAGMLAMAVAMGIGRFVYTPILPMMNVAGELSMATGGLLAGANFLGYLVGALGATLPVFMAERRRWFYLALALSVATSLAMAIDFGFAYMAVIRFASGVASAFAMIFISALVMARLQAEKSPQLVSLHFGGVGLGISVSAISVALVDNAALGWQMAWLVAGMLSLAGWLAIRFILPPTLPEIRHRVVAGSSRKRSGGIVLFILGYGLFGFGYVITATFINAMARAEPVLAPIEPWVWLVVGLAGIPSIWFWNRLAAHWRDRCVCAGMPGRSGWNLRFACVRGAVGTAGFGGTSGFYLHRSNGDWPRQGARNGAGQSGIDDCLDDGCLWRRTDGRAGHCGLAV